MQINTSLTLHHDVSLTGWVRWPGAGTHVGAYLGYAATGRRVKFAGIEIIRVEEGRVTDRWGEWDADSLRGQLGSPTKA